MIESQISLKIIDLVLVFFIFRLQNGKFDYCWPVVYEYRGGNQLLSYNAKLLTCYTIQYQHMGQ